MTYFVTGATGFIGRRLVSELLEKRGTVYFLVRKKDPKVLADLYKYWGVDKKRAIPVTGDLTKKNLGVSKKDRDAMHGKVRHVYHLAALYDITAPEALQEKVNVEGTRQAVVLAEAIDARCFHHVSSIAAAGLYEGVFREDMFDEAKGWTTPYSPHQARARGRRAQRVHDCRGGLSPGYGGGRFAHRRDGQDRRAVLFLQAASRKSASSCRRGCRPSASRAVASTSCRSTSWSTRWTTSPQEGSRQEVFPPDRPEGSPRRRRAQHLRQGRARAGMMMRRQRPHVWLHSEVCVEGPDGTDAGAAHA